MRRFQEAGRSTSSTPKGQQAAPPSVSPKHRPDKIQKTPSADYRRQGTQGMQKEAGDIKKAAQQAAER